MKNNNLVIALIIGLAFCSCKPPAADIYTRVDFADSLFVWDGFGVNYVQSAQWRGIDTALTEDYGGFSQLDETERKEILELIFGEDGLKPSLLKMFLDPYHEGQTKAENDNNDPFSINWQGFDHTTTTNWMRYFAKEGLKMTREQNRDLEIITTLYGPAPWMTEQKFVRGRDLDENEKYELAEYIISWAKYLKEQEGLPVKFISLHNEGENNNRWDAQGKTAGIPYHDHNMWWPKEQIVDFLKFMPEMLSAHGLEDVGITPGECVGWNSFLQQGIPHAIASDSTALKNMSLITSHSFGKRNSTAASYIKTIDKQYNKRDLHTWTTSFSFIRMYIDFLYNMHNEIYTVNTNGIIMWAPIQVKNMWVDGEPNPGCAIWVENGDYTVRSGYYFLKSFTRMGLAGMNVVRTYSTDKDILITAFNSGLTNEPSAFNVLNVYENEDKKVFVKVDGSNAKTFTAYRTSMTDNYVKIGEYKIENGGFYYTAPMKSSTTFFEN